MRQLYQFFFGFGLLLTAGFRDFFVTVKLLEERRGAPSATAGGVPGGVVVSEDKDDCRYCQSQLLR